MYFIKKYIIKNKQPVIYAISLSLLLFILKWLQWKFLIIENSIDIYVGLIAVFFTLLGIWIAKQLARPKMIVVEKEVPVSPSEAFQINEAALEKLQLSQREWEVLQLMAKGQSNAEIAQSLFLSVSTVKTHASNIFSKMNAKSRTRAMATAKDLGIVP